jgi:hypothetical protein
VKGMNFKSLSWGRMLLIEWTSAPNMSDVQHLGDVVASTHRKSKRDVLYVALIPAHLNTVPSAEVRRAMISGLKAAQSSCESIDLILLAEGVAGALLRSALRGMAVVTGRRKKIFIHDSPATAIARLAEQVDNQELAPLKAELANARSTLSDTRRV